MRHAPRRLIATTALGVLLLAGCGGDADVDAEVMGTADASETTTTTDDGGGATESTAPETSEGGEGSGGIDAEATDVSWTLNAIEFRGQDGSRVAYDCPAGGTISVVWGTDTYTDDSSVCTAAVHAGLISVEDGGRVVIEIAPGEEGYTGSEANGVTSNDYGSWDGSFTFPSA